MEDKDLNNEHTGGGIPPSSKSRSRMPVARPRSRHSDAATHTPKWKRPNAQKHGFFSMCLIVPGEDPQEFRELHSALIEEWQPSGPTEEDAVFGLADLMWRKRRAQNLIQVKLNANSFYRDSPTFIESRGLALFTCFMATEPIAFEQYADTVLRADRARHLKQNFPRSNFQSTAEWANAILMEINSAAEPKPEASLEATEAVNKLGAAFLTANAMYHAREFFEYELNLRERLDAMIARQFKHLAQIKAMKQMLRQASIA